MNWTCLAPDGCERADQVALIDRVAITEDYGFCEFWSTQDPAYRWIADLLASDSLPPDCYWMSGFAVFGRELASSQLCLTEAGFRVELSIPNQDEQTHSRWRVDGQYLGRLADTPP